MTFRRRTTRRAAAVTLPLLALLALAGPWVAVAVAAGPPFPPPEDGRAVYDTAGVLQASTIGQVEQTIDAIEQRTGAEIAVFTRTVPFPETTDEAEANARALMDQWGVGRKGFDDGLVILFDLNEATPAMARSSSTPGRGSRQSF